MKNYHHSNLPSCFGCISLSQRDFNIFLCVSIGLDTLFTISYYSDSASWWPQNSQKMALAPEIWRMTTIIFQPFYRVCILLYHRGIDFFLWVNIGLATLFTNSHYSDLVSWWSQKNRKMALDTPIWRITTTLPSHIIEYEHNLSIETLIFFSGWISVEQF